MRRAVCLVLLSLLLAGCAVRGDDDPFAYMRKPLYAGSFDLRSVGEAGQVDQFWVTDGSIGQIRVQVWVNATAGEARVVVKDASGHVAIDTTSDVERNFMLDLGAWSVTVTDAAGGNARGSVGVMVTRV